MSKMDNLRAMREARYDKAAARAKQAGGAKPAPAAAAPVAPAPVAEPPVPEVVADASADELCGHRNMSGRTCTREKGHAAKSHRYS
jgi:hypothetical protein